MVGAMKSQLVSILAKTSLGILACTGMASLLMPQASLAQSYGQPLDEFSNQEANPFGAPTGGSFSPFNLIHNAQFGNLQSMEEYSTQQRVNLNDAAEVFRRQQLEKLRQSNQTVSQEQSAPQ